MVMYIFCASAHPQSLVTPPIYFHQPFDVTKNDNTVRDVNELYCKERHVHEMSIIHCRYSRLVTAAASYHFRPLRSSNPYRTVRMNQLSWTRTRRRDRSRSPIAERLSVALQMATAFGVSKSRATTSGRRKLYWPFRNKFLPKYSDFLSTFRLRTVTFCDNLTYHECCTLPFM